MASNLFREIGRPGTEIWSGYIERPSLSSTILSDDYLSAWTPDTVDKMLRSDGQVAAIWRAIVNTIQSAEWYIEPVSDSKGDKKVARFVEDNLWPLWGEFLRQLLLYLAYGFMVFEVVYEERNGQIHWKALAPRLPWTIERWIVKNNKLDHVIQYAQDPETGSMQYYKIPANKILRFTNEQEGLNFEGRALALDTPIPTPNGWRTMGDLKVGDPIFDETGKIRYVVGVKDFFDRPAYKVIFDNGDSIVADENHLWYVEYGPQRTPRIVTTKEMAENVQRMWSNGKSISNYAVPLTQPVQYPKQHLPLDPYYLGLWLGDGYKRSAYVASSKKDAEEVARYLKEAGYTINIRHEHRTKGATLQVCGGNGRRDPTGPQQLLRALGLLNNKHIPEAYLHGSIEQRLALLQGLMDSDGTVDRWGRCEFTNTNRKIIDGILELLASLGIKASCQEVPPSGNRKLTIWRVHFVTSLPVFRLPRKRALQEKHQPGKQSTRLFVKKIEYIGKITTRCIETDAPSHLFLAGRTFVPTHNSIFRAAYKHWKIKDVLYKIAAIRHERWGVGIPVGTLPEHVSDEEEEEYKKILKQLRSNEAAYIYLPKGSNIDEAIQILTPRGGQAGSQDLMELIRHHDVLIARSVLAEFVSLGESRFGSRAVSRDLVDLFMLALEGITKYIGHTVTYGNSGENLGITDLVRLNFGENVEPPRLVCGRVRRTDVPQMISSLARLIRAGGITPDEAVENSLRAFLGLPLRPTKKEQHTLTEMQDAANFLNTNSHVCQHDQEELPFKLAEPGTFWRELFPWEEHVNFAEYQANFNRLEELFVNAWREALPDWVALIKQELGSTVTAEDLPRLRALTLPPGKLADGFYRVLLRAYEHGRASVKEELEAQARGLRIEAKLLSRQEGQRAFQEPEDDRTAFREREEQEKKVLRGHAEAAAENLARKVKRAAEYWALAALTRGQVADSEEVVKPLLELSDRDARLEAYATVSSAWGMGRNIAGDAVRPLIYYGIYSAVLDQNTCAVCRAEDGRIVMPGEQATPNPACFGGLRCRCITLWALADPIGLDEINERWGELGW